MGEKKRLAKNVFIPTLYIIYNILFFFSKTTVAKALNDISQKQGSKKIVNKLKLNENNKEYIVLGEGEYRGDYFLSDNCTCLAADDNIPYDNYSNSRPMLQTRLTQE